MKRIIIVLCGIVALMVSACTKDDPKPTDLPSKPAVTEPIATPDEPSSASALKSFITRFDDTPTIGDQQLYKDEKLTVTAHGINYAPIAGPEIHLTVESRYDKDVTLLAPYAVINDYMIDPELKLDIPAGKTVSGNLRLSYFDLATADITCIREMGFSLRVEETRNYKKILTTDVCTIKTSAAGSTPDEAAPATNGQTVYDEKGVKLTILNLNTDRPYSEGAELTVYIENNTERTLKILTDDVTVNGYDMTSVMNRSVLPGKKAVDVVTFYKMDLDEYNIDTIDSVKLSFLIRDAESWEELGSTKMIDVDLSKLRSAAK